MKFKYMLFRNTNISHSDLWRCCVLSQEEYYGRELLLADRDMVEQQADEILKGADVSDVAFLVVGDPFG